MVRLSERSQIAIPAATAGALALWVVWQVIEMRGDNKVRDVENAAIKSDVDSIKPKLDAIPRIEEDVEWIRAEMMRHAAVMPSGGDQAKR